MAIKFKGDTTVAIINSIKNAEVDTVYRCFDSGVLLSNEIINHGDFVSWDGTKWIKRPDLGYLIGTDSSGDPTLDKKYVLAVNLQQDFTAEEQAQGRANIGAVSAADVEDNIGEVVAAALNNLEARIRAIEEAVSATNLGERTADRLDVQTLLIGGENVLDVLNNINI